MALVIHTIKKNRYAYEHYRVKDKVKSDYIGPVDAKGRIRASQWRNGLSRQPVGTTTASLRRIYMNAVSRKAREDAEDKRRKIEAKKRVVTAKRVKMPEKVEKVVVEKKEVKVEKYKTKFDTKENADEYFEGLKPVDEPTQVTYTWIDDDGFKRTSVRTLTTKKQAEEEAKEEKERIEARKHRREEEERERKEQERREREYKESPEYKKEQERRIEMFKKEGFDYKEFKQREKIHIGGGNLADKKYVDYLIANEMFYKKGQLRDEPLSKKEATEIVVKKANKKLRDSYLDEKGNIHKIREKLAVEMKPVKDKDMYTVKDVQKLAKEKYGLDLGKADDPSKTFTKKEVEEFEIGLKEEKVRRLKRDVAGIEEAKLWDLSGDWYKHDDANYQREEIMKDPDKRIEAIITYNQHATQAGTPRKKEISREKAKEISQNEISRVKRFVDHFGKADYKSKKEARDHLKTIKPKEKSQKIKYSYFREEEDFAYHDVWNVPSIKHTRQSDDEWLKINYTDEEIKHFRGIYGKKKILPEDSHESRELVEKILSGPTIKGKRIYEREVKRIEAERLAQK